MKRHLRFTFKLIPIMVDPLSAAGLAIGILDVLITLGERRGDLISTAQAFEDVSYCIRVSWRALIFAQDTATFYNLVNDENIQTKLLSNLMFSECAMRTSVLQTD
jgi:hypothetical protein